MILSSYVCSMYVLQMAARGSRAGQTDPGVGGGGGGGGGLALIGLVSCVLPLGQVVLISGQQLP